MDTLDVVYYACLNNDCPKHRNVFVEGDPEHRNCARKRLWLEGQRQGMPRWVWFAIPAALAMASAAVAIARMRKPRFQPPMLRETEMKTWSGAHSHREDREGNAVPPPISS
jgi:hypothetical protein